MPGRLLGLTRLSAIRRGPSPGARQLLKRLHISIHRPPVRLPPPTPPPEVEIQEVQQPGEGTPESELRPPPAVMPRTMGWCDVCVDGSGVVECHDCDGEGYVATQPGGAGVPFYVGTARCKLCNGLGVIPCMLCGGIELVSPPPDPVHGPEPTGLEDIALTDDQWLSLFPDSRDEPREGRRRRTPTSQTEGGDRDSHRTDG